MAPLIQHGPEIDGAGGFAEGDVAHAGVGHGEIGAAAAGSAGEIAVAILGEVEEVAAGRGLKDVDVVGGCSGGLFAEHNGVGRMDEGGMLHAQ